VALEATASLEGIDAAVIALDPQDTTRGLTAALDRLDRDALPRLMLADGPEADDASLPLESAPELVAATLRGMLSRQPELDRLRREAAGSARLVGGLRGDLARMHDELHLAAQVQREFLPKSLPSLPRARVAAMWRPAHWVSGDIYDVRRLDEHHLGLFVADAVGHGVPAALMTMVVSRALPSKEIQGNSYRIVPPGEALARLNIELLRRESRATRFVTAVYAVLDTRTMRVRLASAGHPAPVVLRGASTLEVLHAPGGVLGVFEDDAWEEIEADLRPGDRLLMHSDGFEAAVPEDPAVRDSAATDRHLDTFRAMLPVEDPAEILRRLGERIDRSPPAASLLDDITLLALRVD
jgi:serine phosphatase RsbU (regulator of sigma subunit)